MKVKDVLESDVITVPHEATHLEAAKILYTEKISSAPVVDGKKRIIGMISEKDLFKALYPSYKSFIENPQYFLDYEAREGNFDETKASNVKQFMTKNVISVTTETPILRAGAIMLAKGIHTLPVVTDGSLVGVVTRDDIYQAILKRYLN